MPGATSAGFEPGALAAAAAVLFALAVARLVIVQRVRRRRITIDLVTRAVFSTLSNGALSITVLTLLPIDPAALLARASTELPFVSWLRSAAGTAGVSQLSVLGAGLGAAVVLLGWCYVSRRPSSPRTLANDWGGLTPGRRGMLFILVFAVIGASVAEEFAFRMAIPAALFLFTDNVYIALLLPLVLFAIGHLYQGRIGPMHSAALGAAATVLYLVTGSILVCIVLHALYNANAVIVWPAFVTAHRRRLVRAAIQAHRTATAAS